MVVTILERVIEKMVHQSIEILEETARFLPGAFLNIKSFAPFCIAHAERSTSLDC